jgi:hypothetical protein
MHEQHRLPEGRRRAPDGRERGGLTVLQRLARGAVLPHVGLEGDDDAGRVLLPRPGEAGLQPGLVGGVAGEELLRRAGPRLEVVAADDVQGQEVDAVVDPAAVLDECLEALRHRVRLPLQRDRGRAKGTRPANQVPRMRARRSGGSKDPLLARWQSVHSLSPTE